MNNSIQYFLENGIPGLEKIKKDFFTNPMCFDEYIENVKNIVLDFGCHIISETLEECNTLLEESFKRRLHWHVKDLGQKNIMSPLGMLSFTRTRFKNKETKETAYLLDRVLGLGAHARMSDGVKAAILEEAVQTSYEKAGKEACPGECVSRETVMRHVRMMEIPPESQKEPVGKKKARKLYVEADEDHAALQFHKKKGDIKRFKGHADNTRIVKLVYVHEGYKDSDAECKELKNVVYFGGLYRGKDNEKLWNEVKKYITGQYGTEGAEKIYFQSDGGAWMKKGLETLGAEFVLDGFHIQKYIRKMARLAGDTEETREENREKIQGWIEKGSRKELEQWAVQIKTCMKEKDQKKLEESLKYIKNNWQGIRRRIKNEEGITGSSTESHISHVLSSRLSSRPKGWCMEGLDKMAQLRTYWKNGGSMLVLVKYQKEEKITEKTEEEKCFSATEMLTWENKHRKTNGKYIEALRAGISSQISAKIFFNASIAGLC
ncbi:ISLre2 family transposase [Helicobacter typhlonius]|uniref:ISLre2 family transposase n=1 Tax=Helicobacter typhlonius TaxID=76936 RepID=UPI002FE09600